MGSIDLHKEPQENKLIKKWFLKHSGTRFVYYNL